MSEQTMVVFVQEWQTGVLLLLGSVTVGFVVGAVAGTAGSLALGLFGFLGGSILAFLAFSYLLYGR